MNDETITEASLLTQLEQARRERDEWKEKARSYLLALAAERDDGPDGYGLAARVKQLESQIAERAAALCQSCPLLAGSAELLKTINELRLRRIEAEANDELHKRAAVTLGKWYLSAKTRQALDNLRTCEFENGGS